MLKPIMEARRHQSTPLEPQLPARGGYRTISDRGRGDRNAWNKEEAEIEAMLAGLPYQLAQLESFSEK